MSKYKNTKRTVDGITFDSVLEANRYAVLRTRLDADEISDLRLQPRFTLVEGFKDLTGTYIRPVQYIADFSYLIDGKRIVEDTKGVRTSDYILKRKLMRDKFGVEVHEVTRATVES